MPQHQKVSKDILVNHLRRQWCPAFNSRIWSYITLDRLVFVTKQLVVFVKKWMPPHAEDVDALIGGTIVQQRLLQNAPCAIGESELGLLFRGAL